MNKFFQKKNIGMFSNLFFPLKINFVFYFIGQKRMSDDVSNVTIPDDSTKIEELEDVDIQSIEKKTNSQQLLGEENENPQKNLKNYKQVLKTVKHVREPTGMNEFLEATSFPETETQKMEIPKPDPLWKKFMIYYGFSEPATQRSLFIQPTKEERKTHSWFHSNQISTTKYTWFTFLPKNLFEQFAYRHANIYFAFIAILCLIPTVSPIGTWSSLISILWVIGVQMLKDIVEDTLNRYSDFIINHIKTEFYDNTKKEWKSKYWENVKVGDVVRVRNKHTFPADLLFIDTSDPAGSCFVETASLDGETDLKHKQAIEKFYLQFQKEKEYSNLHGRVVCDAPNRNLYEFRGNLEADQHVTLLNVDNLLLRV
jgi:magnesium-transporting ATPase (P-type)